MANVLGTRPMTVDAPSATVLYTEWMKISNIVWAGYTADTHTFVIQNANGDRLAQGAGASDLSPIEITVVGWVHGLIVPTLASGVLYIYIE